MVRLELPIRTPSLNELLSWARRSPWKIQKLKQALATLVLVARCEARAAKATGPRRITITRHSPRELDADNLAGGCKPLLDELKRAGLIVDDAPRWLVVTYKQAKSNNKTTTIEIEEA